MRKLMVLLVAALLAGCGSSSPQQTQYETEYSQRQDIRKQSVYRFATKPMKPSGEKYWGAGDLAQLFYVIDAKATVIELAFNYPAKTLLATARDAQNNMLKEQTYILLAKSDAAPAGENVRYIYLTKDGELAKKTKNCTPDMSVGCQWWNYRLFITRSADLAVQYEQGGAGLAFLVIPMHGSNKYLEIFPKAAGS